MYMGKQVNPSRGGSGKTLLKARQSGFSLLEMAIVLVVIGLLLGGALVPLSVQMEKRDRDSTRQQLADMRQALIGFALVNGRLPCPDTDGDGMMDIATTCTSSEGTYPWVDLGVGRLDAWGRPFTYRVTASFADTNDGTDCAASPTEGLSFSLCSEGDITVLDADGGNFVATVIPAIMISHGKNWALSASTDEAENTDADAIVVDRVYSSNSTGSFDDLVTWVAPNILKSNMLSAGFVFKGNN